MPERGPEGGLCPACLVRLACLDEDDPTAHANGDHELRPGDEVGSFKILELLGEGGMGLVYLAEQREPVQRRVALKLIKWGMDTKAVVARFESERQALALMNHPNIARVFDGGATESGRPYFVMEYVKGVPLTEYCDGQRSSMEERLRLFMQVCEGVQHAHQKGIIHRDLKPSNILVRLQDGKPVPKIIDFGVAKATSQRLTEKTIYTQVGQMVGTPEYMSPEQVELTTLDVDTRTDVYSLGVVLYELLVGTRPFDPGNLRAVSLDEIRRMIREEEPSKPSTRLSTPDGEDLARVARVRRTDVSTLRRLLQGDLDWITMRALEKDRARRYGSPAELAADLARHLEHEPVLAGPPTATYRLRKFVRRHRVGVAATAIVSVALLVGMGGTAVGLARAVRAEAAAKLEAERANQEAETARRVSEFLVGIFEVSDPNEARGSTVTARELLDKGSERIERDLADQPLVQAQMMDTMGRVYTSLGLFEQADRLLPAALEIRERELGPAHALVADTMSHLARPRSLEGRLEEAVRIDRQALAIYEEVYGPEHVGTARCRWQLGSDLALWGKIDESRQQLTTALGVLERELGPDDQLVAWCLNDLGVAHVRAGEWREALPYVERALRIKERTLGSDHPDTATGHNSVGYVLANLGEYERARSHLERALAIQEKVLGTEHPTTANILQSLGELLYRTGELDEAEKLLEQALRIQTKSLDPDSPDLALTRQTLAAVRERIEDRAMAAAGVNE